MDEGTINRGPSSDFDRLDFLEFRDDVDSILQFLVMDQLDVLEVGEAFQIEGSARRTEGIFEGERLDFERVRDGIEVE